MLKVLSYYQFATVPNPEELRDRHLEVCRTLGVKGRVYVATEGVNGTCAVPAANLAAYEGWWSSEPGFETMRFKEVDAATAPFEKLIVKVRPYLVNFGTHSTLDPREVSGYRLTPSQWRQKMEEPDVVVLDVRNPYEWEVGRFRGAIAPTVDRFADFDRWVDELDLPKDRPVLTYCTGGIRCEKFTGLLRERGYDNVFQLDGGILDYVLQEGGEHFEGELYVFDDRMTMPVGGAPNTWSRCGRCGEPTVRVQNCANIECNDLFMCCEGCAVSHRATCSESCEHSQRLRVVDPSSPEQTFKSKGKIKIVDASAG
jgi:UPF0176 protein